MKSESRTRKSDAAFPRGVLDGQAGAHAPDLIETRHPRRGVYVANTSVNNVNARNDGLMDSPLTMQTAR